MVLPKRIPIGMPDGPSHTPVGPAALKIPKPPPLQTDVAGPGTVQFRGAPTEWPLRAPSSPCPASSVVAGRQHPPRPPLRVVPRPNADARRYADAHTDGRTMGSSTTSPTPSPTGGILAASTPATGAGPGCGAAQPYCSWGRFGRERRPSSDGGNSSPRADRHPSTYETSAGRIRPVCGPDNPGADYPSIGSEGLVPTPRNPGTPQSCCRGPSEAATLLLAGSITIWRKAEWA